MSYQSTYSSTSFQEKEVKPRSKVTSADSILAPLKLPQQENLAQKLLQEFPNVKLGVIQYQLNKHNNQLEKVREALKNLGYSKSSETVRLKTFDKPKSSSGVPKQKANDQKPLTETSFMDKEAKSTSTKSLSNTNVRNSSETDFFDPELERKKKQLKGKFPWLTDTSVSKILETARNNITLAEEILKQFEKNSKKEQEQKNASVSKVLKQATATAVPSTKTTTVKKVVAKKAPAVVKAEVKKVTTPISPSTQQKKVTKVKEVVLQQKKLSVFERGTTERKQYVSKNRVVPVGPNPLLRNGPNKMNRLGPQPSNRCGPNPANRQGPTKYRSSSLCMCA